MRTFVPLLICLGASLLVCGSTLAQDAPPSLSPKLAKKFGSMLERDWKNRPEWAEELVALLKGGGMGMGQGWFRASESRYGWEWLRKSFDSDDNNRVDLKELPKSEDRALFFARLDVNRDAAITEEDFQSQQASPNARFAGDLFFKIDSDSNGRVTRTELSDFFAAADPENTGFLTPIDFTNAIAPPPQPAKKTPPANASRRGPPPAEMIAMLLRGELGSLGEGPKLNGKAPDFKLSTHDGEGEISLAELKKKKKPIILVFGSFT